MSGDLGVWLVCFVWTLALELPIYAAALRRAPGRSVLPHQVTLGLNLLTHPMLFFATAALGPGSVAPGELLVVVVEGAALARWVPSVSYPWRWAAAANLVSWQVGGWILGWMG